MRLRMFVGITAAVLLTFAASPVAAHAAGTTGATTTVAADGSKGSAPAATNAVKLSSNAQKVAKPRVSATKPVGSAGSSTQFVYCYNPYLGYDYYHVACNSDQWYTPWVQCSNGFWYAPASYIGHWEIWTFCPIGLQAIAGVVTY